MPTSPFDRLHSDIGMTLLRIALAHPVAIAAVRFSGLTHRSVSSNTPISENIALMNIYVGNLSYEISEDELRDTFSQFGTVSSCKLITDRETGRTKGFGFVEMDNNAEADAAIKALNDKPLKGRAIKVNEAKPRADRPRGGRPRY